MTNSALDDLKQLETRRTFREHGTGPWVVVYRSWHDDDSNGAFFAAFASKSQRKRALQSSSWDFSIGDGAPGFMQSYSGGRTRTTYLRYGNAEGLEPVVLIQELHGAREAVPQVSEEFRLYHNLWIDPKGNRLIKVDDDGSESVAAEIRPKEVRIRTQLLRQFQAARQLDLLLFIDSVRFVAGVGGDVDLDGLEEEVVEETSRYDFHASRDALITKDRPFSRFLGKKILPPPPRKKAGVWPYEEADDFFPEFIIGEDETGSPIRYSCDPDGLANYFGANPDAPHYLTPVFFRREVLQRYYDQPEKYSVEDGYLRCVGLWGVQIDNDHPDHVMAFLGDLGRDLPARERDYWRSFNIAPVGQMSLTTFRRSFLAQFSEPSAPDLRFKSTYARFRANWRAAKGWDLFKELPAKDAHVLQRLRVPLTESQPELEAQVLNLAKLLVDSLNESHLLSLLGTRVEGEKGIAKLERWLRKDGYPHVDRDVAFLRKIQALRSRMAAHRKGSDYEQFIAQQIGDQTFAEAVARLLLEADRSLNDLADHFGFKLSVS